MNFYKYAIMSSFCKSGHNYIYGVNNVTVESDHKLLETTLKKPYKNDNDSTKVLIYCTVLMIRVEICPDITLSSKNTLTFPLIMYT